ncbi:hypothetical protein BDQ17DRAFT_1329031 [Cyathus striatus]|nr:hypothetical protein BDQ17DRAFT_1329031 [Cyathus striatus]
MDFRLQIYTSESNINFRMYSTVRTEVQPVQCFWYSKVHVLLHVLFWAKYTDIIDTGVSSTGSVQRAFQSPGGMWFPAWWPFYTGAAYEYSSAISGGTSGTKSPLVRSIFLKYIVMTQPQPLDSSLDSVLE